MIKLIGPGQSTAASGSLAKAIIFSLSKKTPTLKKHASPRNPKTGKQTSIRAMMKFLSQQWQLLTPAEQATWENVKRVNDVPPYHKYIAENQAVWRTGRAPSKTYPATRASAQPHNGVGVAIDGTAMITIRYQRRLPYPTWGVLVFRTPDPVPSANWTQLVAVFEIMPQVFTYFRDTPLSPGTYHYRVKAFNEDGKEATYWGPFSGTAT